MWNGSRPGEPPPVVPAAAGGQPLEEGTAPARLLRLRMQAGVARGEDVAKATKPSQAQVAASYEAWSMALQWPGQTPRALGLFLWAFGSVHDYASKIAGPSSMDTPLIRPLALSRHSVPQPGIGGVL